jgi:hypothetical protein
MLIECIINRPGPTEVSVGGQHRYRFEENSEYPGHKIAFVSQSVHQEYFLKSPHAYREFNPETDVKSQSALQVNIKAINDTISAYNSGQLTDAEFKEQYDRMMGTIRALEEKAGTPKKDRYVSPLDTGKKDQKKDGKDEA